MTRDGGLETEKERSARNWRKRRRRRRRRNEKGERKIGGAKAGRMKKKEGEGGDNQFSRCKLLPSPFFCFTALFWLSLSLVSSAAALRSFLPSPSVSHLQQAEVLLKGRHQQQLQYQQQTREIPFSLIPFPCGSSSIHSSILISSVLLFAPSSPSSPSFDE